ncbi:MAG: chorismate-binding protein [Emcibacter sp.]|nr:chorismate-binding protein [Emcibacter sp.]
MSVSPDFQTFKTTYDKSAPQVVWTTLVADLETAISAFMKLGADTEDYSCLLESVEGGAVRGRYSIIGLAPDTVWRCTGNRAEINRDALRNPDSFTNEASDTLTSLRALLEQSRIDVPEGLPPMVAGVFGYMGYDTIRLVEDLPNQPPEVLDVPDGILVRPTTMVIFDAVKDEMTVVSAVYETGTNAKAGKTASPGKKKNKTRATDQAQKAYSQATARLAAVVEALDGPVPRATAMSEAGLDMPDAVSNTAPGDYMKMVETAKEYIAAGDIFQVVLSQRFEAPFELPSLALYRSLRRLNPSPFLFHLDFGAFSLVGSSPEILVRVRGDEVTIRPIAGTAIRGANVAQDQANADALLADPKERAEHLMLLDLGRNDTGRVSKPGTVEVTDAFSVERYSHVMHIVSNVEGELDRVFERHAALVLRPDRYIFGVVDDNWNLDALMVELGRKLGLG